MILLAIALFLFFVFNAFREYSLTKTGVPHTATVVGTSFGYPQSPKAYIEYFVNGEKYKGRISGSHRIGDEVDIFYDTNNPISCTDGDTGVIGIILTFVPLLISLVILVGYIFVLLTLKRQHI